MFDKKQVRYDPTTGKVISETESASTPPANTRQQQEAALAKKTHQDLINAAYKVADKLQLKGGPWPLLRAAGWGHLTDNRGNLYKGPFIDDIEGLTTEQKAALKTELGL